MGAGNRSTRIHNDAFVLTDDNKLISGSHDYCNFVWPLDKDPPKEKGVFTATRNDAKEHDPFEVLDDYYWAAPSATTPPDAEAEEPDSLYPPIQNTSSWTSTNERAGWWVRTPNQVLCFWHAIALSNDHSLFGAARPGKLFVWDLKRGNDGVCGYQFSQGPQNWLGRLAQTAESLRHRLSRWFLWDSVVPKQAIWMVLEDGEAVYIAREELLQAAGVRGTWEFGMEDFDMVDGAMGRGSMGGMVGEEGSDDDDDDDDVDGKPGREKRRRVSSSASTDIWEEAEGGFTFATEVEVAV